MDTKQDIVQEMDRALAVELLARVKAGVATASELREARTYINDNKELLSFDVKHPANELLETLPDLSELHQYQM